MGFISQEGGVPDHIIEPYDYFFDNGFQILDVDGIPRTFGVDEDNNIIPSITSPSPASFSIYSNITIDFVGDYNSSNSFQLSIIGINFYYSEITNIPSYYINYTTNTLYPGPIRNIYAIQSGMLKSFFVYMLTGDAYVIQ